jgi:putative ABC transport system ATP-binding protein
MTTSGSEQTGPATNVPGNVAVICRGVTKDFGTGEARVRALQDVNVEIAYGCLTLLVGPSGCGKTTLISIMAGLLDPTAGDVTLLGKSRRELNGRQLVRFRAQNIGFVFQQYNLLPALTAAENVAVPLLIRKVPRREAVRQGDEMLQAVGLGDRAHSRPVQLSGGQQQRVAIARALVNEPRLLVCDEPTAALDAHSGRNVMELLRKTTVRPDRAVIVVTHDSRVFDFGDQIISMSDGRVESIQSREQNLSNNEHSLSASGVGVALSGGA